MNRLIQVNLSGRQRKHVEGDGERAGNTAKRQRAILATSASYELDEEQASSHDLHELKKIEENLAACKEEIEVIKYILREREGPVKTRENLKLTDSYNIYKDGAKGYLGDMLQSLQTTFSCYLQEKVLFLQKVAKGMWYRISCLASH